MIDLYKFNRFLIVCVGGAAYSTVGLDQRTYSIGQAGLVLA